MVTVDSGNLSELDLAQKFWHPHSGVAVHELPSEVRPLSGRTGDLVLPPTPLQNLGEASFLADFGVAYPYVAGAMANGIASAELVRALANKGFLAIFGSAGLTLGEVAATITTLKQDLGSRPFGSNLIHSPQEPELEEALVDLYLEKGIHIVEASAFMSLSPAVVRYSYHGIYQDAAGQIHTPNRVIAKVSRREVAEKFLRPAPSAMLATLVAQGHLSEQQAAWAAVVPVAQDVTAEADSGGHTDNRPALTLLPTLLALKDALAATYPDMPRTTLRIGAAGGIGTPQAAAAAFTMGAAYIVTGSVNQACQESGSCDEVRQMLAAAAQADIAMAPAADMFEMGIKVQVLKKGTMFPMRAAKLYELYRQYQSLEDIPPADAANLEKNIFRRSLNEEWLSTREFFLRRDPHQVTKAEADPRHKMALVFRAYLGQSSRWANRGAAERKWDYQVWCGPAMGAFNEWTRGSFLEDYKNRDVVTVAFNLLYGAVMVMRGQMMRSQGLRVPACWQHIKPLPLEQIQELVAHRVVN